MPECAAFGYWEVEVMEEHPDVKAALFIVCTNCGVRPEFTVTQNDDGYHLQRTTDCGCKKPNYDVFPTKAKGDA